MLRIRRSVLDAISDHARRALPNEACGYLAQAGGVTVRAFPLTNADASPEHFSLVPQEQFAAVRAMRAEGLSLRAVYHSHPSTPARPSAEDIRLSADPALSYVILSLAGPAPDTRSFLVRNGDVQPEELQIEES